MIASIPWSQLSPLRQARLLLFPKRYRKRRRALSIRPRRLHAGAQVSVRTRLGVVPASLVPYASHPREARGCDRRRKSAASKSAETGASADLGGFWGDFGIGLKCRVGQSIWGSLTLEQSVYGWLSRLASGHCDAYLRLLTWNDFVQPAREPIFNVPVVVLSLLAIMGIVHALTELVLSSEQMDVFLEMFAFVPARYDLRILRQLPWTLGWGAAVWTFLTYAFIHGSLMHL